MIYITGDPHGDIHPLKALCKEISPKKDDVIIVLGDFGANYFFNYRDEQFKKSVEKLGVEFFIIRGNHEANPANINSFIEVELYGGKGFIEPDYPDIFYAKDGEIYTIENHTFLVLGGAYSVDKYYRLKRGWSWFSDEQITKEEQIAFMEKLPSIEKVDFVLSHTAPFSQVPTFLFLNQVDQSTVDSSMELFLDEVEKNLNYHHWFFGHYHDNYAMTDKISLIFHDYLVIRQDGSILGLEKLKANPLTLLKH